MEMRKQLIIGLPETGKTTFLAALWHVVEQEEVPGSLVVSEVHGVRDYLNKIREEWLQCHQFERTKIPAEKIVSFRLRDPRTGRIVELSLPDLSGETFRLQWESRQWTTEFDKLASEASGALLFVHPRTVVEPVRIDSTVDAMAAAIGDAHQPPGSRDTASTVPGNPAVNSLTVQPPAAYTNVEPWSPVHTPTQVKLVEILQFLCARSFRDRPLPLVVIVSAWDLIPSGEAPRKWLEKRLPLLAQFLQSNFEAIQFEVLGMSAQGGELSRADELQRHIKASDRIIVAMPDQSMTHDITAPIKWLLER